MFNHGKFNLKRFNLPGEEITEIVFRDQFTAVFEALLNIGEDIYDHESISDKIKATARAGALVDGSETTREEINASVAAKCNLVFEGYEMKEAFRASVKPALNIYISFQAEEQLLTAAKIGEDVFFSEEITGNVKGAEKLGLNYRLPETITLTSLFNCLISTAIFDTETITIGVSIAPGGKLVIDSENFVVLLDGENALDKHSGAWLNLARNVERVTFSPAGSAVAINVLYTERYL